MPTYWSECRKCGRVCERVAVEHRDPMFASQILRVRYVSDCCQEITVARSSADSLMERP